LTGKNKLLWLALALVVAAAGCSTPRKTVTPSPHYKVGAPYKVAGRWYHPRVDEQYNRTGLASWYGAQFHGRKTANGEIFDMNRLSAAHTTLPLPSLVEIKNLENGRRIVVRVNDRGPFVDDRIIDVSRAVARRLGFEGKGLAQVSAPRAWPMRRRRRAAERRRAPIVMRRRMTPSRRFWLRWTRRQP